jgi:uncharacterized protein YqeY
MAIIDDINNGIKDAMRQKDQIRLETLRMLKAKILAVDARANVSDQDAVKLFKTYLGNLQEALEQTEAASRFEMSEKLKKEIEIVMEFLPKAPSVEETKKLVIHAISETGAQSKKDFGQVMKHVLKHNSAVDGKLVKQLADEMLEG